MTSSNLHKTCNNFLQKICAWLHVLILHHNCMYTDLPPTSLELFLGAIWNVLSWAIVLIWAQIKPNSKLSCCTFFKVGNTEQKRGSSYRWFCAVKTRSCSSPHLCLEPFGYDTPCPKHRVSWWQPSPVTMTRPSELSNTRSTSVPVLFLFYIQRC